MSVKRSLHITVKSLKVTAAIFLSLFLLFVWILIIFAFAQPGIVPEYESKLPFNDFARKLDKIALENSDINQPFCVSKIDKLNKIVICTFYHDRNKINFNVVKWENNDKLVIWIDQESYNGAIDIFQSHYYLQRYFLDKIDDDNNRVINFYTVWNLYLQVIYYGFYEILILFFLYICN